jgi:hypothetical protein
MKRSIPIATVAAAVALLVPAAHGTTEPDEFTTIDVTITDSRIILSEKTADRGEGIDFRVRNIGKKPHSFALLAEGKVIGLDREGLDTPLLKPKQTSVLQVFMDLRGSFVYRSLAKADRAKPGMHGKFLVL